MTPIKCRLLYFVFSLTQRNVTTKPLHVPCRFRHRLLAGWQGTSHPSLHFVLTVLSILLFFRRLWLLAWMINNMGVTLLNKAAFAKVDFKYPFFLSSIHMICNSLGSQYVFWSQSSTNPKSPSKTSDGTSIFTKLLGSIQRQSLDAEGRRRIIAFSFLFSLNIAMGNVSLKFVSVC